LHGDGYQATDFEAADGNLHETAAVRRCRDLLDDQALVASS
jgi:hypothetical protein